MAGKEVAIDPFEAMHAKGDAYIRRMEGRIGVPEGTFHALRDDDNDWSFLIKLQAIVEAGIVRVVTRKIGAEELMPFVSRLAVDGTTGKLKLALILGVMDEPQAKYVRQLANIRNRFAHSIENIAGSLGAYVAARPAEWRRDFARNCTGLYLPLPASVVDETKWTGALCREMLWGGAMYLLTKLLVHDLEAESEQWRKQLMELMVENRVLKDSELPAGPALSLPSLFQGVPPNTEG